MAKQAKNISILGSTGSIGKNTLRVVEHLDNINVVALGAGSNIEVLASQVSKFQPEIVSCLDEEAAELLTERISKFAGRKPRVVIGEQGLIEVATYEKVETVVSATVGAVGFVPTLRALESGKRVALANKETLVMAGELMTKAARENKAEILPVDSEHNALHQCLRGEKLSEVKRLILTASGGPFRTKSKVEIENASREDALNHPTWNMGDKISIDSATLMNKGLEVIEAHWLFGFNENEIDVVVHPQSVVHSMIELVDGSMIAQLGVTDMKHAIQYALTYPERVENCLPPLDFAELSNLTFENPDFARFPNLGLAYQALKKGGTAPAALNASNEIAVQAFLDQKIRLTDIAKINELVVAAHEPEPVDSLKSVLKADRAARVQSKALVAGAAAAVSSVL